jgi:putative oxidoreductase
MFNKFVGASHGVGELILRVCLGAIFIPHGWMKLDPSGPMGGPPGFAGFLAQLQVPVPGLFAWVVALLESVGAVMLITGLATRVVALGLAIDMLVAICAVKIGMSHSAFTSSQQAMGWGFELALFAGAAALAFLGGGRYSLDARIRRPKA